MEYRKGEIKNDNITKPKRNEPNFRGRRRIIKNHGTPS